MSQPPHFQLFTSLRYDPLLATVPANAASWPSTAPPKSPFYMLPHHRDRILQAATHFSWTHAASIISGPSGFAHLLSKLEDAIPAHSPTPLRVRVLLRYDGTITVESNPVPSVAQFNLFPSRLPPPQGKLPTPKVSPLTGGTLELGDDDSVYGDPPTSSPWDVIPDTVRIAPSPYTSYKTTSRDMYASARGNVGIKDLSEKKEVLLVSEKDGEIMEGSLTSVFFWRDGRWVTPTVESGGQIGTTRRWALEKGLCVEGDVRVDELLNGEECWISNGVRGFQYGKIKLRS